MSNFIAKHTHIIKHDHEAIHAAYHVADFALGGRNQRDQNRELPVAEVDFFSQKGLGGIRIPREFGGLCIK